jgi:hypothetical protein
MMFIHHMIGIMLTTFSYVNNMVRVGALIFCLHDFADPLLEVRAHPGIHESFLPFLICDFLPNSFFYLSPRLPRWPIMPDVSGSVPPFL